MLVTPQSNCRSRVSTISFVIDETTVDSAASQRTPADEGVDSRQPNAAAIVPLASIRQWSELPNTDDPGDHEATEATGRLTRRKRPLGRTERGEYQPSEDSAADTAWTRKRLRSRAGAVVDVSQTQHKNGGSPQNAVNKRRQMQDGRSKRRMSPRVGRKKDRATGGVGQSNWAYRHDPSDAQGGSRYDSETYSSSSPGPCLPS